MINFYEEAKKYYEADDVPFPVRPPWHWRVHSCSPLPLPAVRDRWYRRRRYRSFRAERPDGRAATAHCPPWRSPSG